MSCEVRLVPNAAAARITHFDGQVFTLESPQPFAPGQPIQFGITLAGNPVEITAKSLDAKRLSEKQFCVRARAINLSRMAREALLFAVRP